MAAALAAAALAGCGSTAATTSVTARSHAASTRVPSGRAFAWVHPAAAPAGWRELRLAGGAMLPYPRAWERIHGDPGTASAARFGPGDRFLGYLNITPRQGAETLRGWAAFRVEHNREEGDRQVTMLGVAGGLRFRSGPGACVRDRYTTASGARYVEIACLVSGARGATVVVAATPPDQWPRMAPILQQAISAASA